MSALFDPPHGEWTRIRFALAWKQRLSMVVIRLVFIAVLIAASLTFGYETYFQIAIGLVVVTGAWRWWMIGRWVRNFGYAEQDDDLWITSGALLRRLTVVPFGRMQLVDVAQGPIDRVFKLADVQLHTASASSDAHIPGLAPDQAAALRDRLTELGASELSGL